HGLQIMQAPIDATTTSTARSKAWNAALAARPGALDLHIAADRIEGVIPPALRGGRMLSNGPGWTRIGDWTAHPFDGHGYVRAFEFQDDGSVRLRARFVETRIYRDELAAGRFLHRGFATNVPGPSWRNLGLGLGPVRNVANTTVLRWGDRLLAGWEGGEPHALDPDSLATRGPETLDGAIAGQITLAHMARDPISGRLITCSISGRKQVSFCFREFDDQLRQCASSQGTIEGPLFTHDFAFTRSWTIVADNPLQVDGREFLRTLLGRSTLLRSIATRETPGLLHLIARDQARAGETAVRTIRLPGPAIVVHFANAHEEEDGTLIIDACAFDHFDFGEEFGYAGPQAPFDPSLPDTRAPQRLRRYTIAPGASEARCEQLIPQALDFPRIDPRQAGGRATRLFGASRSDTRHADPFDTVLALDLRDRERPPQLWTAPRDVFVGEPIPAVVAGEEQVRYVMALLSDGLREQTTLAIFAADDLAAGPVAAVPMPLLPIAFHGDWDTTEA
ncbi:MAG: carotenoid oxygenase family protein, partial [Myxococcales bacterium]|nr:carotenoid oxygenase family protein [Myxococcales bacterium]